MMGRALSDMLEEKKEEEQVKVFVLRTSVIGDLQNVKVQSARLWTAGKKRCKSNCWHNINQSINLYFQVIP